VEPDGPEICCDHKEIDHHAEVDAEEKPKPGLLFRVMEKTEKFENQPGARQ
jgi:hypothetical protein